MRSTPGLDPGRIAGVEHPLPGHIQPVAKVAYIHQPLLGKAGTDQRIHVAEDCTTVSNRCLSSFFSSDITVKPDFHRPLAGIRLLVVQRNMLMGRVFGRGIHALPTHFAARRRAEFVVEQGMSE